MGHHWLFGPIYWLPEYNVISSVYFQSAVFIYLPVNIITLQKLRKKQEFEHILDTFNSMKNCYVIFFNFQIYMLFITKNNNNTNNPGKWFLCDSQHHLWTRCSRKIFLALENVNKKLGFRFMLFNKHLTLQKCIYVGSNYQLVFVDNT